MQVANRKLEIASVHLSAVNCELFSQQTQNNNNNNTRLTALCLGLPRWVGTTKVKPIWILLKQETASGSGISCAICKCAPHPRQIQTHKTH